MLSVLLKGSWDLVTGVIIRVTILITPIKVLITSLTKSRDPPSRVADCTSLAHTAAPTNEGPTAANFKSLHPNPGYAGYPGPHPHSGPKTLNRNPAKPKCPNLKGLEPWPFLPSYTNFAVSTGINHGSESSV